MLWHSKSVVSMTSVCFGITKVQCQKLNLNGYFFSISYMPVHVLLNMFFFVVFFSVLFILFSIKIKIKKIEKSEKYKNNVCFVYIGTCVPWMAIETKFFKLCISCTLDEHLYAQLSKWALWLLFVMSKIKLFLILNTHITLFDGNN